MASADLDFAELHVSLLDYVTKQPYIDASGLTSLDLPYESVELVDQMYEPSSQEIPTARITLPSLIAFPELRPLLQKLREGNRVEIYNFQPDCGAPVFAGFIPPNGITEQDGNVVIDAMDTMVQLRWQHLRKYEYLQGNAAALYRRALSTWQDIVNEDFASAAQTQTDWTVGGFSGIVYADGFLELTANGGSSPTFSPATAGTPANGLSLAAGDTWLLECDGIWNLSAFASGHQSGIEIGLWPQGGGAGGSVSGFLLYNMFGSSANMIPDVKVQLNDGTVPYDGTAGPHTLNASGFSMPISHHLAILLQFGTGTVTITLFLDHIAVQQITQPWQYTTNLFTPFIRLYASTGGDTATVDTFRARRLQPVLRQAGRFNPQTTDNVTYQANSEENLQFLQYVAAKDNAEYRPVYKAWPQTDELELDEVGTLGAFPSRTLGYEQPGASPKVKAPDAAPFAVVADPEYGDYLIAPPFRFEEGWNLAAAPKTNPRDNAHANDVVQLGASTLDAQVFGEKFSVAELGRPQSASPGQQYPCFEQIVNDDRVFLDSLAAALAGYQLSLRTDGQPSLELEVADEVWSAFRWRAGDSPYVVTRSLRTNLEQEMRVMKVQYKAGSPARTVTLGRIDMDPSKLRLLHESAMISWLYDQSGTSPLIYAYPNVGNLGAGAGSADFTIQLDQYTTGSAIVYAALHWLADANVMKLQPVINGGGVTIAGFAGTSNTDSGLIPVTQYFQSPGQYKLHFINNDSVTRSLTAAFLVFRIKG